MGYRDSLGSVVATPDGPMRGVAAPAGADWDLAVIHVVHPDADYCWVRDCPRVLDATYLFEGLSDSPAQRSVV